MSFDQSDKFQSPAKKMCRPKDLAQVVFPTLLGPTITRMEYRSVSGLRVVPMCWVHHSVTLVGGSRNNWGGCSGGLMTPGLCMACRFLEIFSYSKRKVRGLCSLIIDSASADVGASHARTQ